MENNVWPVDRGPERRAVLNLELARFNGGLHLHDRQAKYKAMTKNPFAFYRATAHLFYRDLAAVQLLAQSPFGTEKTTTWIQGDLHLDNFGAFCDSEGDVVFDLNDFDESWIACYLFDLWRGATSLVLTARANGFSEADESAFTASFVEEYLLELARANQLEGRNLDKVTAARAKGTLHRFLKKAEQKNNRRQMLDEWTHVEQGQRRFRPDHEDLAAIPEDDRQLLASAIQLYQHHLTAPPSEDPAYFQVLDAVARCNAGLGSLGVPRYYVLLRGEDDHPDSCRILDLKQQGLPSYFVFLDGKQQQGLLQNFDEDRAGLRVAMAQRCMLMDPDRHLGGMTILNRSFSIRERSPFKKKFKVKKLRAREDFQEMAHHWGTILAAAHARADRDYQGSMVSHLFEGQVLETVAGREKDFVQAISTFAGSYADQVIHDHQAFTAMFQKHELI